MLLYSALALILGFALDYFIGEPQSWWHPVEGIGWLIEFWEKQIRGIFPGGEKAERAGGVWLVILVLSSSMIIPAMMVIFAYDIHPAAGILMESFLCWWMLSARSLVNESTYVAKALAISLEDGREAVSMMVGRDTDTLNEEGVVKAAVETVAENTCDGVIAPMFYMFLGGGVGGFLYKAVNTMDSMVGYKNEMYMYFGTAAARLDDLVNFIPARLSARLMILACRVLGWDSIEAKRIYMRDRYKHESPNAAHSQAAMAGALGVRLGGDAWYFGVRKRRRNIGDGAHTIGVKDISRAQQLMYVSSMLGLAIMAGTRLTLALLVFLVQHFLLK